MKTKVPSQVYGPMLDVPWRGFDEGLRWLHEPPASGVIAVALRGRSSATFAIENGEVISDGWAGNLQRIRKIAEFLRQAAALLEKSTAEFEKEYP